MEAHNLTHIKKDFRCEKCNKLLARQNGNKTYEIKCTRCGALNVVLDEMPEQVIVTDPKGVILFVNNMVEKNTGYSLEEAIGQKPSLWGGQMSKQFYEKMWHTISIEKKGVEVVVKNRHKSGRMYFARLRISPVVGTDGEVAFYVGFESVVRGNEEAV